MAYSNAIFYIDLYNGNDAARTALTGAIASNPSGTITRITKAAHGLTTGAVVDLTLFTTWLNGAWKITVVDANSFDLDNAIWQTTADTNGTVTPRGGSSWADAWKTPASGPTSARIMPGDEIRGCKTPNPSSVGSATWLDGSVNVILAAAQTSNVTMCDTVWTAANGGVVTLTAVATDAKEGAYCMQIAAPASPATATKYAYFATGLLNLSSRQKLSFWLKNEVAIVSGNWKVCLCSDTAGSVIIDEFEVGAIPSTARWLPLTVSRTGGGNLGAAIQSIALYSSTVAPTASKYIRIDNIIACTAGGLSLQSLISKNGAAKDGDESYHGLRSINGTALAIDNDTNGKSNATGAGYGYTGGSETVETFIRETFKTPLAASTTTQYYVTQKAGTEGALIKHRWGFNPATNEQDGETYFDGSNGYGYGFYSYQKMLNELGGASFVRYNRGVYSYYEHTFFIETVSNITCCTDAALYVERGGIRAKCVRNISNSAVAINLNYAADVEIKGVNKISAISGYAIPASYVINALIECRLIRNIATYGLTNGPVSLLTIKGATFSGLSHIAYFASINTVIDRLRFIDCDFTSSGFYVIIPDGSVYLNSCKNIGIPSKMITSYGNKYSRLYIYRHNQVDGDNRIYGQDLEAFEQSAITHESGPVAWAVYPQTYTERSPGKFKVAEVYVVSGSPVNIKLWVKKFGTGENVCRLVLSGINNIGVAESYTEKVENTDWEQMSLSITPTNSGVIELFVYTWRQTTATTNCHVYIGPIKITQ